MTMTSNVGTPLFRAPEVMAADEVASYTTACDVWSLGLVAWCLTHCDPSPFKGYPNPGRLYAALRRGVRPTVDASAVADVGGARMAALMAACWEWEARSRPAASAVLTELEGIAKDVLGLPAGSAAAVAPAVVVGAGVTTAVVVAAAAVGGVPASPGGAAVHGLAEHAGAV